jgi:hypothetical protein
MTVVRLSALRTGRVFPQKYSWYSFLLEAGLTPGLQCCQKDYVNDTIGNRTRDIPACGTLPQPNALSRTTVWECTIVNVAALIVLAWLNSLEPSGSSVCSEQVLCIQALLLRTQENISHWLLRNFSSDVLANVVFLHNVATVLQDVIKERHSIQMIVAGNTVFMVVQEWLYQSSIMLLQVQSSTQHLKQCCYLQ